MGKSSSMTNRTILLRATLCLAVVGSLFYGVVPAPAHADEHGGRRHWRHEHWQRYDDYRHRPDVYYSAPPAVIIPQGYYARPQATLSFGFPLFR